MVLDEWIEAVEDITVPVMLFFGGRDPFIERDRIQQIDARFRELGKSFSLKVYADASHGFFCYERDAYHAAAAKAAWHELTQFFRRHLKNDCLLNDL